MLNNALLILSAAPVFSVGLAEDMGYDMSTKARLIASAVSSLVAILLFKVWLVSLGIPGVDTLSNSRLLAFYLQFSQLSVLLTLLTSLMASTACHPTSQCLSLPHCQLSLSSRKRTSFDFFSLMCRRCIGIYGP